MKHFSLNTVERQPVQRPSQDPKDHKRQRPLQIDEGGRPRRARSAEADGRSPEIVQPDLRARPR